jgi:hypothetical protein
MTEGTARMFRYSVPRRPKGERNSQCQTESGDGCVGQDDGSKMEIFDKT